MSNWRRELRRLHRLYRTQSYRRQLAAFHANPQSKRMADALRRLGYSEDSIRKMLETVLE